MFKAYSLPQNIIQHLVTFLIDKLFLFVYKLTVVEGWIMRSSQNYLQFPSTSSRIYCASIFLMSLFRNQFDTLLIYLFYCLLHMLRDEIKYDDLL